MAGFVKNVLSGKVANKIKGALPLGAGDKLLTGLLGSYVSAPGRSPALFGEGEVFLIKSALYMSGVQIEPSAYEGVGERWKEQVGVYQFDPNFGKGTGKPLPAELALPHGFHVPVILDESSPFTLVREKGVLYLKVNGMKLLPVEYETRPEFYSKNTSDGVEMFKLAQHRLSDELMVTYNTYCDTIRGGRQCRFCSLSPHEAAYRGRSGFFIQTPQQIAEIAAAAYSEGIARRLELTGGILPGRADIAFALEVGNAVKNALGMDSIPGGHAVIAPPNDLSQVEALRRAGWESVYFNLEVWEPNLFAGLCPGKNEIIGREKWLEALDRAVEVFGRWKVGCILIAGLEPLQSYLEGEEYLTKRGINANPIPWAVMPGSLLEGHNTPSAQWHITLAVKTLDLWERLGRPIERVAGDGWFHFNDLAGMRVSLRRQKEAQPDFVIEEDLRYKLAYLGQLAI